MEGICITVDCYRWYRRDFMQVFVVTYHTEEIWCQCWLLQTIRKRFDVNFDCYRPYGRDRSPMRDPYPPPFSDPYMRPRDLPPPPRDLLPPPRWLHCLCWHAPFNKRKGNWSYKCIGEVSRVLADLMCNSGILVLLGADPACMGHNVICSEKSFLKIKGRHFRKISLNQNDCFYFSPIG